MFALCIMALALTIYLTLNLEVTTVMHGLDPSYLQIYLPEPTLYVREVILIRESIFVLSNENHLGINELRRVLHFFSTAFLKDSQRKRRLAL